MSRNRRERLRPVPDSRSNSVDDAHKLDANVFPLEPGAALILDMARKGGHVGGDDVIGQRPEAFGNCH